MLALFRERDELVRDRIHLHFTAMEDDKWRAEPLCEIDGLKRLANRAVAFLCISRRNFVAIRRSLHDLDRQRTEVVQAGELDFARLVHFLDARHERNPDAMPELDAIESKFLYLAQHFRAICVPAGVPAGGERDHRLDATSSRAAQRA